MSTQPIRARDRHLQHLRKFMSRTGNPIADRLRTTGNYLVAHPPLAQGGYYVLRGLWPLLGAAFFWSREEGTTFWHAQATGVLILAIGVTLLVAGMRHLSEGREAQSPEIWCLAVGSALGLSVLQIVLVSRREISSVHLLDVAIQGVLLFLWGVYWFRRPRSTEPPVAQPITAPPVATVSLPDPPPFPPVA